MKKFLSAVFVMVFILFCFPVTGQKRLHKKESASTQLENLHNGYLFFQLFDRTVTKKIIRENLGEKGVAEYQKELDETHSAYIAAFKKHYTFSKVAFFHSDDKKQLKAGNFSEVKFYNVNNELADNDTIDFSHFFIAEVSRIELDSATTTNGEGDTIKIADYSFSALIVRNRNFVQLDEPFPYYVRTMEGMPIFQKKAYRLIRAFQNKLERKYSRVVKRSVATKE